MYLGGEPGALVPRSWQFFAKMPLPEAPNARENRGVEAVGGTQTFARSETSMSPESLSKMMVTVLVELFVTRRLSPSKSAPQISRNLAIFRPSGCLWEIVHFFTEPVLVQPL